MYSWVKPKCVIPVHGEHRHMIEHTHFAKEMQVPHTVQVENGDIVKIFPGSKPEIYDRAPSGRLYVDGNISVEEDANSIKERKNIANNGYMEITILVTAKGNLYKRPIITTRGIPIIDEEEFIYDLEEKIDNTAKTFSLNSKKQEHNLIDALKIACRKYSKEKTGKRPFTNINIIKI
jgi:ribonuclease J